MPLPPFQTSPYRATLRSPLSQHGWNLQEMAAECSCNFVKQWGGQHGWLSMIISTKVYATYSNMLWVNEVDLGPNIFTLPLLVKTNATKPNDNTSRQEKTSIRWRSSKPLWKNSSMPPSSQHDGPTSGTPLQPHTLSCFSHLSMALLNIQPHLPQQQSQKSMHSIPALPLPCWRNGYMNANKSQWMKITISLMPSSSIKCSTSSSKWQHFPMMCVIGTISTIPKKCFLTSSQTSLMPKYHNVDKVLAYYL